MYFGLKRTFNGLVGVNFISKKSNIILKARSSHRRCSIKKVFLKISQNSEENTGVFL